MAEKNKLSIYLIKDEFADNDSQILKSPHNYCVDIDTSSKVYFAPSQNTVRHGRKLFYEEIWAMYLYLYQMPVQLLFLELMLEVG